MVYVKMVNIVTLMGSLGVIKKRSVYAIRKLIVKKVGPIRFQVCWSYINWKIFSKPLKRYCYYYSSLALFRTI